MREDSGENRNVASKAKTAKMSKFVFVGCVNLIF